MSKSSLRNTTLLGWIAWPGWVAAAVILVACWTPSNRLPKHEKVSMVPNADKLIHVAIFAAFGMAASWDGRRRAALIVGVLLAIVSELGQATAFVNRDANFADGSADVIGLGLGIGLAWLAGRCNLAKST